jgi:hypothetical protein
LEYKRKFNKEQAQEEMMEGHCLWGKDLNQGKACFLIKEEICKLRLNKFEITIPTLM